MVSEKPTRRSRQKREPATIDLEAAPVSSEAEPAAADDKAVAEALTELPDAIPAEAPVTAEEAATVPGPEADTSELPSPSEPKPAEDETAEEITTAEALSAEPPPEGEPEKPAAAAALPVVERRSGTSVTGALAAGIVGGLVALAGAGGLQYAGYLPSLGAPETVTEPAPPAVDTTALEAEIAALKSEIASVANRPAPEADTSALEARIATLETAPASGADVDLGPLEQKIAAVEGQLSQLEGAIAGTDEKQESLQTTLLDRLQQVEAEVNDPARRNAVARAIAASGLKAAIDRGGSFVSELETFAGVAPGEGAVAGLAPYAETGVPTRAALIAAFPDAANAVLSALEQPDPDQGIAGRLWAGALSLVKVRPVGQVEGDTPEAFLARSEDALKNGDLDTALSEWNRIPEAGRAAAGDFGGALAARIEVEKLVGATLRDAVIGASGN
ncbi:mitofilin family membrane protein [Rhizobiaceae bacterium BDR2-2]|uniref:Mitofilin family membrane protein n=1 Tax=Ectorhizobium quercum TaxID=2965071 RepID=A0AAE3N1V5_9HYPH|nr:mitofilin family membrane protein [Ectorhizobium quercum]MCX8999253.1 mitofilin family membrane protein [Ectorhizobium quercum]